MEKSPKSILGHNRVPQIILIYWIIKITSTTLGETGADMFSMTLNIGYSATILVFFGLFVLMLVVKLIIGKYNPTLYWTVFTLSAVAGTAISDFIDRTLGLGYVFGSLMLVILLIMVLGIWKYFEKSVAVENIRTSKAELFYWLAFIIANTLGTAAGDFLADSVGLGFLNSAILIIVLLVIITLLHFYTTISGTVLFWFAFVLTRPFGATFGDLLTKTRDHGGLNLGTVGSSLFFTVVLIFAVMKESQYEKLRNEA